VGEGNLRGEKNETKGGVNSRMEGGDQCKRKPRGVERAYPRTVGWVGGYLGEKWSRQNTASRKGGGTKRGVVRKRSRIS